MRNPEVQFFVGKFTGIFHCETLLLLKDSDYLRSLDIGLYEVVSDLNMFAQNRPKTAVSKKI